MVKKMIKSIAFLSIVLLVVVGCGTENGSDTDTGTDTAGSREGEMIQVVSTTTMLTDLMEVIGGEQVEVQGLMGPGIDPHDYQATASDVTAMQEADIIVYNGLHLEGQMGEVLGQMEELGKTIFVAEEAVAGENILESEEEDMPSDPHIWFSVPLWAQVADYVTESLSEFDPDNAEYYQSNNEDYQVELEELDGYIRERVEEVPEQSRYLVTAHDAFGYFGDEYGFEVVGLQGLSTATEAGTADVSELADFIVEQELNAIFVETSVPTQTIEAVQEAVQQRGWEVEIGGELYSDALGTEEENTETYLKMYRHNIDTITDALS